MHHHHCIQTHGTKKKIIIRKKTAITQRETTDRSNCRRMQIWPPRRTRGYFREITNGASRPCPRPFATGVRRWRGFSPERKIRIFQRNYRSFPLPRRSGGFDWGLVAHLRYFFNIITEYYTIEKELLEIMLWNLWIKKLSYQNYGFGFNVDFIKIISVSLS